MVTNDAGQCPYIASAGGESPAEVQALGELGQARITGIRHMGACARFFSVHSLSVPVCDAMHMYIM